MATISLHNIRYEKGRSGGRLWLTRGGREVVVGGVFWIEERGRWEAWYAGKKLGAFETEELAREVLEAAVKTDLEGV